VERDKGDVGFESVEQFDDTWAHVQRQLRTVLPDGVYSIWLAPLEPAARRDSILYVEAPVETRDWVSRRFGITLTTAARSADASLDRVELVPKSRASQALLETNEKERSTRTSSGSPLRPGFTFDHFVIGKTNRFAHAAALAVAEMPGCAYTPLFIHGPSGVGKTHLIQAIGNYVTAHDQKLAVLYSTAENFTTGFVSALHQKRIDAFKASYRELDVLLLDDIHFLERKDRTAEEFLFTLDAIAASGAQVVLSGDRHPLQMRSLGNKLNERFQGGLVVEVERPDLETRVAILRKIASGSAFLVGKTDLLELLAERLPPDIRILEGALVKLTAYASLTEMPLTPELVEQVLSTFHPAESSPTPKNLHPRVAVAKIQQETCNSLQLERDDLLSRSRARYIVYARQVAMYLARDLTNLSFPAIAREFGGKDHTAALYAYRKTKQRLISDPETQALIASITERVQDTAD
jgi:chromosomal replication initiator protein